MLKKLFNLFKKPFDRRIKEVVKKKSTFESSPVTLGGKHSRAKHKKGRDLAKNHPCGIVHMNQHREDGRRMRHVC